MKRQKDRYIEEAIQLVPSRLRERFVSDDMQSFTQELASWFINSGMDKVEDKKFEKYAMEIKNISLILLLQESSLFDLQKNKEVMLLLDSIAYILSEKNVILPIKYAPDLKMYMKR